MKNTGKKKILYLITQSEWGGAQRYVFDLADNLKEQFEIIVGFGEQGEGGELTKRLMGAGIPYYSIRHLKRSISPFYDILALIEIIILIKKCQPDIIHLNSSKISVLGSLASIFCFKSRFCKCYVIYTSHGWVFNEPMNYIKKNFYKYNEKFAAIFKNKIICVSECDRKIAIEEKIVPENKLITIHNGVNKNNFLNKEESREKLLTEFLKDKSLNLSKIRDNYKSEFIIGSIGNLYKNKGYEYLIKAINILFKKYYLHFTTCIIGNGAEQKNLQNLIKKYGLENDVILSGRILDAAKYLKAFNIYVCSSVKEGLSYTMIEAMQAGLPIVATNVGGNPELVDPYASYGYETGLLTEPKNPELLARRIKELIDNKLIREKLGENAKIKAEQEFTLDKMINKTREIYNQL
ncbi:MAG: glycosyltransferase [Patescibacteria group bacterium]|nr:glycosyltransferase [Patescibacteria group bacterium]MDD4611200.1 glycosyltransferase [Patescibacteria group bacterium]